MNGYLYPSGGSARDLAMSMHPHPMPTETLMEDAELLHGSATHYYKPPRK
jgi:dihydrolipoamide dehydrogenase